MTTGVTFPWQQLLPLCRYAECVSRKFCSCCTKKVEHSGKNFQRLHVNGQINKSCWDRLSGLFATDLTSTTSDWKVPLATNSWCGDIWIKATFYSLYLPFLCWRNWIHSLLWQKLDGLNVYFSVKWAASFRAVRGSFIEQEGSCSLISAIKMMRLSNLFIINQHWCWHQMDIQKLLPPSFKCSVTSKVQPF